MKALDKKLIVLLRRLRLLKEEPYSQKEAEAAAGLTTDNGKRRQANIQLEQEMAIEEQAPAQAT